ncbi:MAG: branched-chain-amino-acid transaminase [Nitriliruptoraceae bacterium]
MSATAAPQTTAAFGTVVAPHMVVASTGDGIFAAPSVTLTAPLALHPFAHALHYGSACFEGLKAHRGVDGQVRLFRADRHAARLSASAARLLLPDPGATMVHDAIVAAVRANLDVVPEAPGSLYVRPVLLGVEPNIGAAAAPSAEATLFVVASPVGDYFAGGARPLTLVVETTLPRTTPQFGRVKAGANYVMALGITQQARARYGADQVLFAPNGIVQETGAANLLLVSSQRIVTPELDDGFLHGVTRDSLLTLARDRGMVVEERHVTVDDVVDWIEAGGEAALAGTAAVLAAVGTVTVDGREVRVRGGDGDGVFGPYTSALREALVAVQHGRVDDRHEWTVGVKP